MKIERGVKKNNRFVCVVFKTMASPGYGPFDPVFDSYTPVGEASLVKCATVGSVQGQRSTQEDAHICGTPERSFVHPSKFYFFALCRILQPRSIRDAR
jgi:hypothetical protein